MLYVGCHLSSSKGFMAMGQTALELDANTFQFFTRNPRGGRAKELDVGDAQALNDLKRESGFGPIVAHAPYTINPCAAKAETLEFARQTMAEDLQRLEHLENCYYNFHPGSHVGQGMDAGIAGIVETLNQVMFPGQRTVVLLETMAGKGTEVGGTFEQIQAILERANLPENLGVCLDTCHVWDGGYDVVGNLNAVLDEFDRVIGLERLKALHLNDSKNPRGSHKDRHERLGEGYLGLETFRAVVHHPALKGLPMVLETPNELDGYAREIKILRNMAEED